ncbi:MAG: hypothetical protein IKM51_05710, partial [Oscillospiraceae bacterium]|nr:hypothetical protein [Oscillospiraceae bacterium]
MKRSRYILITLLALLLFAAAVPGALAAAEGGYEIKGLTMGLLEPDTVRVSLEATGDCTLVTALYDGSAMADVKTKSITGSDELQNIAVRFSSKLPQGFTVKAFLIDSKTQEPLCKSRIYDGTDSADDSYAVTALSVSGSNITAVVSTGDECVLEIEVLSEDLKQNLSKSSAPAEGGLELGEITAGMPESFVFPENFALRARLVDDEGSALCEYYVSIKYTSAYKTFESKTADDYEDSVVLDFGDNGYGVLVDGAVVVSGIAEASNDYSVFTFSHTHAPEVGDVLVLTDSEGTKTPVKVGSVKKNADGTYTVERDANTNISDLYKVFKLDAAVDVGAAANQGGRAALREVQGDDDSLDLVKLQTGFTAGPLNVSVSGAVSFVVKTVYDAELFGEDYVEYENYLQLNITAETVLTAGIKSSDLKDAFQRPIWPEFTLYEGPIYLVGTGLAGANLEISFPMEFEFETGGRMTLKFNSKSGYSYNTNSGEQPIKSKEVTTDFQIMGRFEIKIGPKIAFEVFVLNYLLEGEIGGQMGLVAKGEVAHSLADSTTGTKTHACKTCLDIELAFFYNIHGELSMNVSEKCSANLVSLDLLSGEHDLGRAYLSLQNDAESLF